MPGSASRAHQVPDQQTNNDGSRTPSDLGLVEPRAESEEEVVMRGSGGTPPGPPPESPGLMDSPSSHPDSDGFTTAARTPEDCSWMYEDEEEAGDATPPRRSGAYADPPEEEPALRRRRLDLSPPRPSRAPGRPSNARDYARSDWARMLREMGWDYDDFIDVDADRMRELVEGQVAPPVPVPPSPVTPEGAFPDRPAMPEDLLPVGWVAATAEDSVSEPEGEEKCRSCRSVPSPQPEEEP